MKGEPLKIVILNDYASPTGGSSSVAISSAIGLAEHGVEVTFFSCVGPVAPQLRDRPNLHVICLDQFDIGKPGHRARSFFTGFRNSRAVRTLQGILVNKPRSKTIVHAHTWSQALSPFAIATAMDMGFKVVLTLHDFFTACPNGQFFVYPRHELCNRKPLTSSCWFCNCDRRNYGHKLWRNARAAIQNKILQVPARASFFISVSSFALKILRPHLPATIPAGVVLNPVDATASEPAPVAKNRDFLFIGRFEEEKGITLFAQAVQAAGVAATFIGDGARMPAVRTISPRSRFTGWLPSTQIKDQLKSARAIVLPSLWHETLGMVAIEAAAAGVPAIVSNLSAATDHIRHDVNGLHFEHGSLSSLTRCLKTLAADTPLVSRLGLAGYDWFWSDPWTTDRHVTKLFDIYNFLVNPAPPAAGEVGLYENTGNIRTWS